MARDDNGNYEGIINPHNGHNPKLVDAINRAWEENKEAFEPILFAFALRDENELAAVCSGNVPCRPEESLNFAHEIMENVCDDLDLECILKFLRKEI